MAEGRALVGAGKWREAITPYQQAIAADSSSHAARHNLALCHLNLREHPLALEAVNRALQKGGDKVAKYFSTKATILLALQRREEAADCVQQGLALDATYANLLQHAARKGSSSSSSGSSGSGGGSGSGASGGGGAAAATAASHHAQGMAAVLGPTLVKRDGASTPTAGALRGTRLTLVYYSASWCGPCRQFSPALMAWAQANAGKHSVELVFASLDKSEAEFKAYFSKLPAIQYAVPFGRGEELGATFHVAGVPSLHVLCDGALVTTKGVEGVSAQRTPFPWVWGGEWVGRMVRVAGLEKAGHLNGRQGLVVGSVEASARYTVNVQGEDKGIAIKKDNLALV